MSWKRRKKRKTRAANLIRFKYIGDNYYKATFQGIELYVVRNLREQCRHLWAALYNGETVKANLTTWRAACEWLAHYAVKIGAGK